jgi:hypothetical protein
METHPQQLHDNVSMIGMELSGFKTAPYNFHN